MKSPQQDKSKTFLLDASLLYKDTCPELSRYLLQWSETSKETPNPTRSSSSLGAAPVCPNCYQWLQPDNHRVRLRPKPRPSLRVQRILRRKAHSKRLSLAQKNLLHRFQKASSALMATCHTCNTTFRHKGANRAFIASLSTPGSAGKRPKTPQSTGRASMNTPRTPGRDKTPVQTPRSSTSSTPGSGSSSTKPPSKSKNWVVQRLSKILTRDDTQGSKKGGLKDFLSSL
ncbi:UPF0711 protein C18orf21 homolog [Takifugu rubripes]|uniref:Si:dkey-184p18.2 n=1 Tax=Takifugu rubripes TaxID=31033 RepID=A0A3B5JYK4_TAKRU|nr:UPF0711 protein C18orf21 homolog [Takifugu rubripes]XP_056876737.1 UPF0711 protein C18orf21 homolog [Takifugu flavidus]|eukprot:XP_003968926.1 PREDICTED: UPF0711 protein C18orf21 homolog [Takifugu rubripes]